MGPLLPLLIIGGAIYATTYVKTGTKLLQLQYGLGAVRINKRRTNLFRLALEIDVELLNPGKNTTNIQAFNGTLQYKGQIISFINANKAIEVPAFGSAIFTVPADIKAISVISNIVKAILNGEDIKKLNMEMQLKGQLKADNKKFPIDETFTA